MNKSIGAQLRAIHKKGSDKFLKIAKETYFDIGNDVIIATPIDEGLALANWNMAYDRIDPTLQSIGRDSSSELTVFLNDFKIDDKTFYLTNSLPYAYRLENGWSKKAANGMVKVSTARFNTLAQQKINKYK